MAKTCSSRKRRLRASGLGSFLGYTGVMLGLSGLYWGYFGVILGLFGVILAQWKVKWELLFRVQGLGGVEFCESRGCSGSGSMMPPHNSPQPLEVALYLKW